jgi:hypothetical protein
VLLRLLRLRLRLRRRRFPPPLRERPSVPAWAGAICVNFAIFDASCFVEPCQAYGPYDAAWRLGGH